jgi:ABC-type branched-subunit amino acid transport system substrate-binding protein
VATTDLLAKYTDDVQVPNVSSDGFGDDQYGRVWDWPAANSATNDGYAMAEYAVKKQGVKTIAMLYFDNPFGRSYKEGYTYYAEKLGAKVVVTQAGSFDDPGTATFIAKARAANVDLLTFNGEPGLWVKMVREAASQGYKPKAGFQGAAGIYFDEIPGLAGPWAEGSISGTHWTPNDVGEAAGDKDPAYAKYSALITKYYPHIKHSNWTKANYSGSLYFVDAVRRLGANVTRKGLKDLLDSTKVWDVGLGAKVEYWCNHRGNHSEFLVKLVKDPDAANSSDSRTRDAGRLGGGMRWKFLEGPYGDPVNHPDGTSDVPAFSKKCS